jgi:hypothetical protein
MTRNLAGVTSSCSDTSSPIRTFFSPSQPLHDCRQFDNALLGGLVLRFEMRIAGFQMGIARFDPGPLFRHGHDHRLERVNFIRKFRGCHCHGRNHSMFAAVFPTLSTA